MTHDGLFKYTISLLVHSKALELGPIERILGFPPRIYWRVGEPMARPTNKRTIREDNYCCFNFDIDLNVTIEENLTPHLRKLATSQPFIGDIIKDGGSIVLAVTWYTGQGRGCEFNCSLLKKIADLQINLGVEVF